MSDLFPGEPLFPGVPATDTRSARRAADRRLHRRRHHRRGRVAMVIAVLLLVAAGYAVWTYAVPMFTSHQAESLDYPGPGGNDVQVIVKPGDTGSAIKGGSFPERILSRARGGEPLRLVADQRVNPTYTGDLAPAAIELAESGLEGVVHVVATGCVGWDEFARAVLAEFEVPAEVTVASTAELGAPAARPLNGCLASSRVAPLRPWREGLHQWAMRRADLNP